MMHRPARARVDYYQDQYGGFVALRLAPHAGVSWQSVQWQSV